MRYVYAMLVGIGTLLASGCGDSTGVTVQDLTGTWASSQYLYTNPANTSQTVDIITTQGASFAMTVAADSTVSTLFDDGQGGSSSDSGTFDATGTVLTLAGNAFDASRTGSQLTLQDDTNTYDFDNDGSDDPAELTITMVRQ